MVGREHDSPYCNNDATSSQAVGRLDWESLLFGCNAALLRCSTSHDEKGDVNVWVMSAGPAIAAAIQGVPMACMTWSPGCESVATAQT